ncbi:MAG: nucleotidyltransferase domain-containing protein [Candidatus Margulisiibacteriota bacterium]
MSKEPTDKYIKDFLSKYKKIIKSTYNPYGVWFFGSRISGIPKEESDIDMIVVSDKFKGIKFIYRMGEVLKKIDYPKHIDALCYTPEEFEKKRNEIGMVKDALEQGSKVL